MCWKPAPHWTPSGCSWSWATAWTGSGRPFPKWTRPPGCCSASSWGTGHAARCAAGALGDFTGDVLVLNGDVPLLSRRSLSGMLAAHRSGSRDLTLAVSTLADPTGYGRILRGPSGDIVRVVEERDTTEAERAVREINVGLYLASADFLRAALAALDNRNDQGEYYLPDIAGFAAERQARIGSVTIDDPREFRGVNNREELAWMEKALQNDINRRWMERGVTLKDPDSTYIDAEATIGEDTVIGPNSHLLGRTVVGARCRIDGSAYLTNVRLADDVHLRFSVVLDDCEVEDRVSVGPFAHLRPGTVLKRDAHIGNFVEVKNSSVGRVHQGQPPELHRRYRARTGLQHRRRAPSPATTTASPRAGPPSATACRWAATPSSWRPW